MVRRLLFFMLQRHENHDDPDGLDMETVAKQQEKTRDLRCQGNSKVEPVNCQPSQLSM